MTKNGFAFYDKWVTLPRDLSAPDLRKLELFIMAKYVWECRDRIAASVPALKLSGVSDAETLLHTVMQHLESKSEQDLAPIEDPLRRLLSAYNHTVRLKGTNAELARLNKSYRTGTIPCQLPSEYVDSMKLWINEQKKDRWLGHGYYWQPGEGKKDTAGPQDYDSLEPSFFRCKNAVVLIADYELLRHDFSSLAGKSEKEINEWLIRECAYLSEGQVERLSPGGDVRNYVDMDQLSDFVDLKERRFGIRQRGFGRAAAFLVGDRFSVADGHIDAELISVKGCGTQKLATDYTVKENGLLSMVDAFKAFSRHVTLHLGICHAEAHPADCRSDQPVSRPTTSLGDSADLCDNRYWNQSENGHGESRDRIPRGTFRPHRETSTQSIRGGCG